MTLARTLRTMLAPLIVAAATTGAMVDYGPAADAAASAGTATTAARQVVPFAAQGCSGDVCIYLSSPSGGAVYVQAWAYSSSFYGYFHLSGPNGLSTNSSTITWIGGKGNYNQWSEISAVVGQYCVTGYSYGEEIGKACESVE